MESKAMFGSAPSVINVGTALFGEALQTQGVTVAQVAWKPPVSDRAVRLLERLNEPSLRERIERANRQALELLTGGDPWWVGMKRAIDVVPGMRENTILHSGPPIRWEEMGTLQRNGVVGGILHEKLAQTPQEAAALAAGGGVELHAAYDFDCIGAGAGIVTAHMAINVCENKKTGARGYCVPFEGRDGLAVWGMYNESVEQNLQQIEQVFAPAVDRVLAASGGVPLGDIITKSLQMGDELHTRQTAAGLYLVQELVPRFLQSGIDAATMRLCLEMFTSTERWFHPLAMAAAMALLRPVQGIPYCTLVTMNCSNGVQNGVRFGALGDRWFTCPAPPYEGQYFSSAWGPADASPHIGDSTVTEVVGWGAFAAAASPVILRLRGGGYREAILQTEEMKRICAGVNHNCPLPLLDFTGPGVGIDLRRVVDTGITPVCHGGIISKQGGQIGAGAGRFPIEPYLQALEAFCAACEVTTEGAAQP